VLQGRAALGKEGWVEVDQERVAHDDHQPFASGYK
jgi:hypothetical protein